MSSEMSETAERADMQAAPKKSPLYRFIDSFIPESVLADRPIAQRMRMFMISHTLGPLLGHTITAVLLLLDPAPSPHVWILAASISLFWAFPWALKLCFRFFDPQKAYTVLALVSVLDLVFAILWGSYHYGGVSSPFLVWLLIVPLLAFFYLGSSYTTRYFVFGMTGSGLAAFYAVYLFGGGFPVHMAAENLVPVGIVSTICAMIYVSMMAVYYANVVDSQSELLAEIQRHRATMSQLVEAKDDAERANGAKSEFLAKMSHELRTPLNAVIGYSEMLLEDAEIDGRGEDSADLKKINAAGKHLLALVTEVLDLSKIEAGKMELYTEEVELGDFIDEVAATCRQLVAKNANELVVERERELGTLECDVTKLRQALLNLLSNAAKFTQNGRVTLTARRENVAGRDWFRIAVTDTGIGIAQEQIDHLFKNFSQAAPSISSRFGGTGLGLSLSQKLCRLMGGDITVESVLGEGTVFTIVLPANQPAGQSVASDADRRDIALETTSIRAVSEHRAIADETGETGDSVLIIDHDPPALELMERILKKENYRVLICGDAREARQLAGEARPDVIVLDVAAPATDGWRLLEQLGTDAATRDIPVIVQTIVDDRRQGFELGAADYLVKPVDREALLEAVGRANDAPRRDYVLLVDDDGDAGREAAGLLRSQGWNVVAVPDFGIALTRAQQARPALVIVDSAAPNPAFDAFAAALADFDGLSLLALLGAAYDADDRLALPDFALAVDADESGEYISNTALSILEPDGAPLREAANG
ncbi:MAG: hypothetical protein TEF_00525 [Rhizobiales bacterium NRL2]|jgi:signal transduction histidine kinase/CheY-like chemotaxis protein|nr:MAG: hypothetical protein TEF_00525 [Rhizobiales bacterium NRL2]